MNNTSLIRVEDRGSWCHDMNHNPAPMIILPSFVFLFLKNKTKKIKNSSGENLTMPTLYFQSKKLYGEVI